MNYPREHAGAGHQRVPHRGGAWADGGAGQEHGLRGGGR